MNQGLLGFPKGVPFSSLLGYPLGRGIPTSSTEAPPVAGYQGHWDASDAATLNLSGADVVSWRDKSGNGNTMLGIVDYPTYGSRTINGFPAIDFDDASGQAFYTPNIGTNDLSKTAFVAAVVDSTGPYALLGGTDENDSEFRVASTGGGIRIQSVRWWGGQILGTHDSATITIGTPFVAVQRYEGSSNISMWLNSIKESDTHGQTFSQHSLMIGGVRAPGWSGANFEPLNGAIGEVIYYDYTMTDHDVQLVMDYLRFKWGAL